MEEWLAADVERMLHPFAPDFVLFLYTPLCGTCKKAERMLEVLQVMRPHLPVYKVNINLLPELAQSWKVTSIPCVAVISRGKVIDRLYAMRSVDHLDNFLQTYF